MDLAVVHGVLALAILVLTPWKSTIARRGLNKQHRGRGLSLLLAAAVVISLMSGLVQSHGGVSRVGPLTVMQIHIGSALLAVALAADHYRRHPVGLRRFDVDRRAFVRSSVLAVTAAGLWAAWEGALLAVDAPGRDRRFTGSHERGSHDPVALPTTSWFDDAVPHIEPGGWAVEVAGFGLDLSEVESLDQDTFSAVLDCTGGWHSEQEWTGVRLDRLIEPGDARSLSCLRIRGTPVSRCGTWREPGW